MSNPTNIDDACANNQRAAAELFELRAHIAQLRGTAADYLTATSLYHKSPFDEAIGQQYTRCRDALQHAINQSKEAP